MSTFNIEQCMHLKNQDLGFAIDRPFGTHCYIFLHFINPVDIRVGGNIIHTAFNACLIYAPHTPQYYIARTHNLHHNYIHFSVNDNQIFDKYELPINELFYTELQNEVTDLIENIELSRLLQIDNFENRPDDFGQIASNDLERLFSLLHDEIHKKRNSGLYTATASFDKLRSLIYQSPKDWDVASMAEYIHLSRSRFSVKYREIYNVTPNEDIIRASLIYAEKLLMTTTKSISDISDECGFNSTEYFIRLFRKRRQTTPGQYRKLMQKKKSTEIIKDEVSITK